ncbi:hypothetical protein [Planobispora rosea]|nr:hypothetical protein [Planobispora rosea]
MIAQIRAVWKALPYILLTALIIAVACQPDEPRRPAPSTTTSELSRSAR